MRFIFSIFAVFAFGLGILTACQDTGTSRKATETVKTTNTNSSNSKSAPQSNEQAHADEAARINLADAKKEFDAGNAVFVDTRAEGAYVNEHIKGAINVPSADFEAKYKEIPTDKKIIAYCS